ncbi:MAG: PEP-CTERM sorting domain-containing protein [Alteraurantiacibacter sp.]
MTAFLITTSAQIPEASSLSLFALGVLGVIVGRKLSQRRADDD